MNIYWGSIAEWVSGFGSLAAVITALYLSRDAQRIKLTGYCGIRMVLESGGLSEELICLGVTNVGNRRTTIDGIGMRVGRFKKRHAIISIAKNRYSDDMPIIIADGEKARWSFFLDSEKNWIRNLVEGFVVSKADAESLRFIIFTTHGGKKSNKTGISAC